MQRVICSYNSGALAPLLRFGAAILFALTSATACSISIRGLGANIQIRAYPGPERPKAELALIVYDAELHHIVVDDTPVSIDPPNLRFREVHVLPGQHTITGDISNTDRGITSPRRSLTFTAEAGHEYRLKRHLHTTGGTTEHAGGMTIETFYFDWWLSLEDRTTKTFVAGSKSRPN